MNNSKSQQHYRLTLEEVIADYKEGLITAPGLLYYYLKIRLAPGWKMTLHQREITEKLGISRAAFYKAIAKLNQQGLIEFETPNGVTVTLSPNGDSRLRSETYSPNGDSQSPIGDSSLQMETPSLRLETRTPKKTASVNESSVPPDSYQIFINSLSDRARERFLHFVGEKVATFPNPIQDIQGWLAGQNQAGQRRFRVYYQMFQKAVGEPVAPSTDWEKHPQRDEWLAEMRLGKPRFVAQGGPPEEQETRKAFADWATAHYPPRSPLAKGGCKGGEG